MKNDAYFFIGKYLFCYYQTKGLFYIRFGIGGIKIKNMHGFPLLFSERIRKRGFCIGNYYISWLSPQYLQK